MTVCCSNDTAVVMPRDYPPGLTALVQRRSTYTQFLERMLAQLSVYQPDPTQPSLWPLAALTTRSPQDPTIALLDGWSVVLDVLDFYQQRWLNENYLSTATEIQSVLQLARAIGYELSPGLAATTWLAFTVDPAQGTASVPQGTQVYSLPSQNNSPQIFEILQDLTASATYNVLTPYQPLSVQPQPLNSGLQQLYLQGVTTGLQVGNSVLLVYSTNNTTQLCTLTQVQTNTSAGYTLISWQENVGTIDTTANFSLFAMRQQVSCFGSNAPAFQTVQNLYPGGSSGPWNWDSNPNPPTIWTDPSVVSDSGYTTDYTDADLYLNQVLSKVVAGGWVVLEATDGTTEYATINATNTRSLAGFGLSGQVTGLTLASGTDKNTAFGFRNTTVFAQSEALALYAQVVPTNTAIQSPIVLNGIVSGLQPGQSLAISSVANPQTETITVSKVDFDSNTNIMVLTLTAALLYSYQTGTLSIASATVAPLAVAINDPGTFMQLSFNTTTDVTINKGDTLQLTGTLAVVSEVFALAGSADVDGNTQLSFNQTLQYAYNTASCVLYGNVVEASHGASVVNEVLGSGDGTQVNQSFTLSRQPLTYLPAANALGSQDTLQVYVNGILWQEVTSFYGQGPNSTCYVVQQDKAGVTHVLFGDGQEGARLPTGQENITATYRVGLGTAGEVASGSLILLQTRPLGIKSVTNPLPATGAADPEAGNSAQQSAPRTVLTLDRVVSLADMEYFTLAYPGIAKVQAALLQSLGQPPALYLTVCGAGGVVVLEGSVLQQNLLQAINAVRTPGQSLMIASYQPLSFNLEAQLVLDPNYVAATVFDQVTTQLLSQFGFDAVNLAQDVVAGDIIELIQAVPGVIAVNLTALYFTEALPTGLPPQALLPALPAQAIAGVLYPAPAQLLTINPAGINLLQGM
jgi:hypothetical protein